MRSWAKLVLVVLTLAVLFWPGIQHHWELSKDRYFLPFDAAAFIPPFFKFEAKDPIPTTYTKEYHLNAMSPLLYKWSLIISAQFGDVRHFQLGMMYLGYAVFIGVLGRLGWLLGGAALSFAVLALALTSYVFLMLGFLGEAPRMYAYPLIALILYSLICDRPYLLAVAVVLGGLLYPIVAIIGGFCLAAWLLLRPLSHQGLVSRWRLSRRLLTVGFTGFLTVAGLVPLMHGSEPYGRRVVEADIIAYPEAGPDGTYRTFDQMPYKLFGYDSIAYYLAPMFSQGDPIVPWLNVNKKLDHMALLSVRAATGLIVLIVIFCGMRSLLKKDHDGGGIRLLMFFVICGALHMIAWLARPYLYLPSRYLIFSLPFLITLIFPWSLYILLERVPRFQSSSKLRHIAFLGIISIYLMAFGGKGNVEFSSSLLGKSSKPLFDSLAALPKDVTIAGWPDGAMQKVEYLTRRNAFLSKDIHQVLHLTFMKTMRQRMDAIFDAYFSTDAAPLYRLRQEFGVTHFLIETRDFTDPKHVPEYFAPWRARIGPRLAEIKGKEYLLNGSLHNKASVFNQNGFILLDLAKLP
jgi:hypothetical protein